MTTNGEFFFIDGQWVTAQDAKISIFDLTVLRGFGVFEFLRTYKRIPFLMEEHIDRLFHSASEMGVEVPYSREKIVGKKKLK